MEKLILPGLRSSLFCKILLYVGTRIVHRSFPVALDGDCDHIYYPQTLAAKTEILELFSVKKKQLISSHSGTVISSHSLYHTLFHKHSLRSPFLSAKNHIVNINLLYRDLVLLALMVILLLFLWESFVWNLGTRFFLRGVGCDIPDFKILSKKY